jgi:hypothetical protein
MTTKREGNAKDFREAKLRSYIPIAPKEEEQ